MAAAENWYVTRQLDEALAQERRLRIELLAAKALRRRSLLELMPKSA